MRNGIIIMTIISGLLFCFIMISASLSPLPGSDGFNSPGMWMNVTIIFIFYFLPLILYVAGVKAMKYVMAVFCGIGLLVSLSIIALVFVAGIFTQNFFGFIGVIGICMMLLIVNIVWYIVAFSKKSNIQYTQ